MPPPGGRVEEGLFFEYSKAANPIRPSLTPRVPFHVFPASLHAEGGSRVIPLDLSAALRCEGPATGPDLCAHFVRLLAGDRLEIAPNASSLVFYVIGGSGQAAAHGVEFDWKQGDFFAVPGAGTTMLTGGADAVLYYVDDSPLARYLGARITEARFRPTLYSAERANAELERAAAEPGAAGRSRISVLLAAPEFPLTRTITHVMWTMYGTIGSGTTQKPHRHQSIALDLIAEAAPGCYSLLGHDIDANGDIVEPTRVDWEQGSVFVTPPGFWHAHVNESGRPAKVIPIQDAGLQTYLRTLDIRFS
ncbi:MAG: cupin [Gluconacetobacter diazotrophicus]|nr:cupin [Gluconacetobacter diazotrophicus]